MLLFAKLLNKMLLLAKLLNKLLLLAKLLYILQLAKLLYILLLATLVKNAAIGSHFSLQVPVRAISISK